MTVAMLQHSALHYGPDGVISAQVIGRARGLAGHIDGVEVWFLDPVRVGLSRPGREALAGYRAQWPAGRIRRLLYSDRLGGADAASRVLTAAARVDRVSPVARRRSTSPLVLHCRGEDATLTAIRARERGLVARIVYDVRGDAVDEQRARASSTERDVEVVRRRVARAVAGADHVVTASTGLTELMIAEHGLSPERVDTVPSCVDGVSFSTAVRRTQRARWGIDADAVVLAYSGKVNEERLPDAMVALVAALVASGADAHLLVLSDRFELADLTPHLDRHGLARHRVHVDGGSRDKAAAWLSAADVGLLLTPDEPRFRVNGSIKLAEYLAAGLVLGVTPWTGPTAAQASRRGAGCAVDPADVPGSARRLLELVADPDARRRATDWCAADLTWSAVAPTLRRAYGIVPRSHRSSW